jgi:putative pyruvate formate lyase activating enzyme
MLKNCHFCENLCGVDRSSGETGKCGLSQKSYLSSAFLHRGEEAPLVPSGTIFFTGCTFDCCFCQNWDISSAGKSKPLNSAGIQITPKGIAQLAKKLILQGALNINYVGGDPTPNLHNIVSSMQYQDENVAQLWNSNLYNTLDAIKILNELMDIWLPDFKYGNNQCGKNYSGIPRYFDVLTRNLKFIYENGSKSIIIRHLVMPNHLECCTKPILTWIAKKIPDVVVNIMGQYRPSYNVSKDQYPEINRRIRIQEMNKAIDWAEELGISYRSVS